MNSKGKGRTKLNGKKKKKQFKLSLKSIEGIRRQSFVSLIISKSPEEDSVA